MPISAEDGAAVHRTGGQDRRGTPGRRRLAINIIGKTALPSIARSATLRIGNTLAPSAAFASGKLLSSDFRRLSAATVCSRIKMFLILSPRSLGFSNAEAAIDDVDLTCSKAGFVGQMQSQGS